jgi:hypothetical protein
MFAGMGVFCEEVTVESLNRRAEDLFRIER